MCVVFEAHSRTFKKRYFTFYKKLKQDGLKFLLTFPIFISHASTYPAHPKLQRCSEEINPRASFDVTLVDRNSLMAFLK